MHDSLAALLPDNARSYVVTTAKGGTGKSTTAAVMSIALARTCTRHRTIHPDNTCPAPRHRVLAIDADTKSQGLSDWFNLLALHGGPGDLDVECVPWSHDAGLIIPFVQRLLSRPADNGRQPITRLVFDTGAEDAATAANAARMADVVISPISPTPIEVRRAQATALVLADIPVAHCVLLTKVDDPHRGRAAEARTVLQGMGFDVLDTEITNNRTMYADVFGTVPARAGAYEPMTAEVEAILP